MSETTTAPPLAWSRAFPATAAQAREARRFLAGILGGGPAADDAVLCLSELVTNATIHSHSRNGGHFTVQAQIQVGRLRVEVRDEGGPWAWPVRRRDETHGRGLVIVGQLAHGWGRAGDSETGWTVWFEMDVPPMTPSSAPANSRPQLRHPEGEPAMIEPSPAAPAELAHYATEDMRAIQAGLTACGLTTHLTDARAGLDLTATFRPAGRHDAEFWIDEEGYAELRYWNPPGTPPAQVIATAVRALNDVTGQASFAPGGIGPGDPAEQGEGGRDDRERGDQPGQDHHVVGRPGRA